MESLGVSERREQIAERLDNLNATKGGSPSDLLPHFDRFMGEKKMHEVQRCKQEGNGPLDFRAIELIIIYGHGTMAKSFRF